MSIRSRFDALYSRYLVKKLSDPKKVNKTLKKFSKRFSKTIPELSQYFECNRVFHD